eukprot:jgi/Chrzof1/14084/Cz08g24170.t1
MTEPSVADSLPASLLQQAEHSISGEQQAQAREVSSHTAAGNGYAEVQDNTASLDTLVPLAEQESHAGSTEAPVLESSVVEDDEAFGNFTTSDATAANSNDMQPAAPANLADHAGSNSTMQLNASGADDGLHEPSAKPEMAEQTTAIAAPSQGDQRDDADQDDFGDFGGADTVAAAASSPHADDDGDDEFGDFGEAEAIAPAAPAPPTAAPAAVALPAALTTDPDILCHTGAGFRKAVEQAWQVPTGFFLCSTIF